MQFFASAVTTLQTLVVALGAGLAVWGVVNLLEGYGNDLKNLPLNDVVSYKISVLSDGKLLAKTTFNRFYKNYNIN